MSNEYLRAFDADLGGALQLVVSDVMTAGYSRAQAEAMVWTKAEARLDAIGNDAGGETALQIADALQDDITTERSSAWPECPLHGSHPLTIQLYNPAAMWTCPETGRGLARLGELAHVRDA
jgi:hypothetical protein